MCVGIWGSVYFAWHLLMFCYYFRDAAYEIYDFESIWICWFADIRRRDLWRLVCINHLLQIVITQIVDDAGEAGRWFVQFKYYTFPHWLHVALCSDSIGNVHLER